MNEPSQTPDRTAVVYTLAAVGFVALVGAGIWLAIYSTRYVPEVVNRAASAAVYLGSFFIPSPGASLSVVPTPIATTTTPSTEIVSTTSTKPSTPTKPRTTAGEKMTTVRQIGGATSTVAFSGLPDLVVTINAVGYLASSSPDSFIAVASSTVPEGFRPAVHFTIKNMGTNVSGSWRFSATIPTASVFLYQSQPQQLLNPGDSIDYTLGFDQAVPGADKLISITANFDRAVAESNVGNNSASTKITILRN